MSVKWYGDKVMKALENANEAGLIAVAIDVQGQAKLLTPVDTGRLRQSISYATSTRRPIRKDGVTTPPKKGEAIIGTSVEYAPHVEYGTRRMRSQSFLRKAVDERKGLINAIFTRAFTRVLQGVK